jgi:trimeric autotransporter adhesin
MKKTHYFFLLLALIFSQNLFAATITWNGDVSNDWANAANWSPASVPTAADDVFIYYIPQKTLLF